MNFNYHNVMLINSSFHVTSWLADAGSKMASSLQAVDITMNSRYGNQTTFL